MALDNAPPKGKGKIGGVKKEYVYAGGAVLVILVAVVYYRSKQQAAQSSTSGTTTVTDPAGNVCAALSPTSGYCPGSPEDLAYQGNTPVGTNAASSVGGQIIGYDQYGNPIYGQGPTQNTGPGSFTNNAEWSQAVEQYLIQQEPNANAGTIATALGAYINGQPVTAAQKQICEQGIAFEGLPPVAGTNGNPPNFVTAQTPPPPAATVIVPNVVGLGLDRARVMLDDAGLKHRNWSQLGPKDQTRTITKTNPKAGTKVKPGTYIDVTYHNVKS